MQLHKRDHWCLWVKHFDRSLHDRLLAIPAGGQLELWVNGRPTRWQRMRHGGSAPTNGFKLIEGRAVWEAILLGDSFTASFVAPAEPSLTVPPLRSEGTGSGEARANTKPRLFSRYIFARYSGAHSRKHQRGSIHMAAAVEDLGINEDWGVLNRETLLTTILRQLQEATSCGQRVIFGCDHQYSIPLMLAREIGVYVGDWRTALAELVHGKRGLPALTQARDYCGAFNDFLTNDGRPRYFWSATKTDDYSSTDLATGLSGQNVPKADPRQRDILSSFRLTERLWNLPGRPMSFSRVGDRGTVGAQTIAGLPKLYDLLRTAAGSLPLAVWPFDGLNLSDPAYQGKHVMVEPYLNAMTLEGVAENEQHAAATCAEAIRRHDIAGTLSDLLSFDPLCAGCEQQVRFEGWIAGNRFRASSSASPDICSLCVARIQR